MSTYNSFLIFIQYEIRKEKKNEEKWKNQKVQILRHQTKHF